MHATKIKEASTIPASECLCRFARRYHAQRPEAGRKATSTVLFSAAIPHSNPNSSHGFSPSRFLQCQRQPENYGQQQRRQTGLPHPARAPEHYVRQKRPGPCRTDRDFFREHSARDEKNRNAGQRGKYTVDAQQNKRRRSRINTEDMEHSGDQVWIQRRFPGCRTRGRSEGVAKAAPSGDSRTDAPHLPTEAEIIFRTLELVGMPNDDPAHTQEQGDSDHPELRRADTRPGFKKLRPDRFVAAGCFSL